MEVARDFVAKADVEMMGFGLNISLIAKEIRQAVCTGEAEPKGKLFAFPLDTYYFSREAVVILQS